MRHFWLTLVGLVVLGGTAAAQQPTGTPLDNLLYRWEQSMKSVQTIEARCVRTTIDKTFQDSEVFEGVARYAKPNMAMLRMEKKGKPGVFEQYICTGTFLYEYVPQSKTIRIHELPPPKAGQVADDNFLSFLFGMKAEEAQRRYDLQLVKQDQWYYYVKILPKFPADKADFQQARLVLNAQTFLPRELWFQQPNSNEVKWDIPKIDAGVQLNRLDFTRPTPPPGWTMVQVPRNTEGTVRPSVPPRVIRQNGANP